MVAKREEILYLAGLVVAFFFGTFLVLIPDIFWTPPVLVAGLMILLGIEMLGLAGLFLIVALTHLVPLWERKAETRNRMRRRGLIR